MPSITPTQIKQAAEIIKAGGIVVYPTDTAYAIGCAFDKSATIKKIMQLKGRQDPRFTIVAASGYQVEQFFNLTSVERRLAKLYWPGPLSIVVSKKFAIRVPNNPIARKLAKLSGKPVLATSCNLTGQPTNYALPSQTASQYSLIQAVIDAGGVVLDAGILPKQPVSTVVEVKRNQCVIHRTGAVAAQAVADHAKLPHVNI